MRIPAKHRACTNDSHFHSAVQISFENFNLCHVGLHMKDDKRKRSVVINAASC